MDTPSFSVSEFNAVLNQSLEYAYSGVTVVGEVAEYKLNQGKWVFFNLKDDESVLNCFIPIFNLRVPIEDGMKIMVSGIPKLTKWGRFSFTVSKILPVGEGNIKKSFELLRSKLEKEGLFDIQKKRPLPANLKNIGVISSPDAAGYADFIKILNERWGGLHLFVYPTLVQGLSAPDQIIEALNYFNEKSNVDLIAIIRGGGSKDDLSAFNDEALVRAVSSSKIPTITGIGHEIDTSLCDLASDLVGSTPSNVATLITRDKNLIISNYSASLDAVKNFLLEKISGESGRISTSLSEVSRFILDQLSFKKEEIENKVKLLDSLSPDSVLRRGYALLRGEEKVGNKLEIVTKDNIIEAEVKNVRKR